MNRTSIEWVKNPDGSQGYTLNSKTGCQNHTPEGLCLGGLFPCYGFRLANGRLKPIYLANYNLALPDGTLDPQIIERAYLDPFYPRFWEERLKQPYQILKSIGIFLDDMSDWMGDYWPREWTEAELQMMRDNPQHRIYTLTKQAQNLIKFSPFPENCWVGVTATGYKAFNNAIDKLKCIEAKVKYISLEPLLEAIPFNIERLAYCGIGWLIIGACTGTWRDMVAISAKYPELAIMPYGKKWTAQPRIEWVKEIVQAADKAGIPVFLKDNLKPLIGENRGHTFPGFAYREKLRQKMPG